MGEEYESIIPDGWKDGDQLFEPEEQPDKTELQTTNPTPETGRDFSLEVQEMKLQFPDLKEITDDVADAWARGVPLKQAVSDHMEAEARKVVEGLKKENAILKQNAANRDRAVVSGTGGVGKQVAESDFMKGFNSF